MASATFKGFRRRKRTKFNKDQYKVLIEAFERNQYPDINIREELAKLIEIPEPQVQTWFQNRRARIAKRNQRSLSGEAVLTRAPILGCEPPEVHRHSYSYQQGLSVPLRQMDNSSGELEHASGQAIHSGNPAVRHMNVAFPDWETPANMPGEFSGDFCSPSLGPGVFPPLASQHLFPQLDTGGIRTEICLETPRRLLSGQHLRSGELHLAWGLQSLGPEMPPGFLGAWEQPEMYTAQQLWPHSASPPQLCPHHQLQPMMGPAGYQEQFLSAFTRQNVSWRPQSMCPPNLNHCELCASNYHLVKQ